MARAMKLLDSAVEGCGTGGAKKVSRTQGLSESSRTFSSRQTRCQRCLGSWKGLDSLSGGSATLGLSMRFSTFKAGVGVFAGICGATTGTLVELSTSFSALSAGGSNSSLSSSSGWGTGVVLRARWEEMRGLEICKMREVSEEETVATPNAFSDRFVKLDNLEVTFGLVLSKHLGDELAIPSELVNSEWENESVGSFSSSPCSDPVSGGFNRASKDGGGEGEFELSDLLHSLVSRL